jgi:tRNA dimethylallyltransferase
VAERRGNHTLHRLLVSADPVSAARIMPADRKKVIRALEVFRTTGRPLSAHFASTASLIAHCDVHAVALRLGADATAARVAARVERQFEQGIVAEVRGLLAAGVPRDARPVGGRGYPQVVEMVDGVRGEDETRALIVTANRQYARRQLIWFRKEPNLQWFDGPGEAPHVVARVVDACALALAGPHREERRSRA